MRDMDPFFHALPDFDGRLDSFFKRRFNNSRLLDRDDSMFGIQSDLDNFKVLVDVKQFKPEELSVRSTDNFVIIEGKHEEKEDSHGFISRHFTRKYDLPKGVKADDVQCNMTASGILEIKAPKPKSAESLLPPIGRKIPISSGTNFSNGINGTQTHKVSSSTFERSHVTSPLADEHTHKISFTTPIQPREQTRREESVESSVSNAGNRRVTIQELSRSSSANSNYNDIHHNHGEHVIPITITAK
jgi:HSP20 family molecular chaperone IbpA